MTYVLSQIGEQLKTERHLHGLSQRAIAESTGTSQARVSHIESGAKDVRVSFLIEYARLLDLELMLVPRQTLPAVKALVARQPLTGPDKAVRTALQRLTDAVIRLSAREPNDASIADMVRTSRELAHLRLKLEDLDPIKSAAETLKRIEETPARINMARAVADELRTLRNRRAHDLSEMQETPRPAYTLDDDDE